MERHCGVSCAMGKLFLRLQPIHFSTPVWADLLMSCVPLLAMFCMGILPHLLIILAHGSRACEQYWLRSRPQRWISAYAPSLWTSTCDNCLTVTQHITAHRLIRLPQSIALFPMSKWRKVAGIPVAGSIRLL